MAKGYHVEISNAVPHCEWDAFVASAPGGHHVQTSLWGQVKAGLGWHAERAIITHGGCPVAGSQVLIRRASVFGAIGYVTQGPLLTTNDPALAELVIQTIHQVCRAHRVQYLAIQPPNEDRAIARQLPQWGFRPSWLELAPTATVAIDLAPEVAALLAQTKRQTRQNIRRSERAGITVREGTEADLHIFYSLHLATSRRQRFHAYPEEYVIQMWRVLQPAGYIRLLLAEYEGEAVSALLIVPFGDTVIAKLLGWSGLQASRRPNDAVFWAAIKWAKASGYRRFDLEGLDPATARKILNNDMLPDAWKHSPDFFKLGFGGQIEMGEAYDYVYSPVANWFYRRLFTTMGHGPALFRVVDRFRRRFG